MQQLQNLKHLAKISPTIFIKAFTYTTPKAFQLLLKVQKSIKAFFELCEHKDNAQQILEVATPIPVALKLFFTKFVTCPWRNLNEINTSQIALAVSCIKVRRNCPKCRLLQLWVGF